MGVIHGNKDRGILLCDDCCVCYNHSPSLGSHHAAGKYYEFTMAMTWTRAAMISLFDKSCEDCQFMGWCNRQHKGGCGFQSWRPATPEQIKARILLPTRKDWMEHEEKLAEKQSMLNMIKNKYRNMIKYLIKYLIKYKIINKLLNY